MFVALMLLLRLDVCGGGEKKRKEKVKRFVLDLLSLNGIILL